MKLAVMQPYLFPYLAYFQLIHAVERFVILDDVTFIKEGWINRNRILVGGKPQRFTAPLLKASSNRDIRDIAVLEPRWVPKLLRTFRTAYGRAPHVEEVMALVESVFGEAAGRSIGELALASLEAVCRYLGMEVDFVATSSGYGNRELGGQPRVIDICRREGASCYVNLPGGRELYDAASFAAAGLELRFLESQPVEYAQLGGGFQPGLSIVDVLMFNGPEETLELLGGYRLAAPGEAP